MAAVKSKDTTPEMIVRRLVHALGYRYRLRSWLANRAEEQRSDPLVYRLLLRLSQLDDPRRYVALFDDLLDLPLDVVECLLQSATHEAHDASALQRAPAAVAGRGIGQR